MSVVNQHDVVIVGAGVAGALIAKQLTNAGIRVLLLEAGSDTSRTDTGYAKHLDTYLSATSKGTETPWPPAQGAPQPDGSDLFKDQSFPAASGYFVQQGPHLYGSTYTRTQGGSALHWLGVSLRMLPEDFELHSRYGIGKDWPISYDTLAPYYEQAEFEIGVSADVEEQSYHDLTFSPAYNYPMHQIPASYSDQQLGAAVNGMSFALGEDSFTVQVRGYPAARNSVPRGGYQPIGALNIDSDGKVTPTYMGERCEGNTACIPICPVQAKYNANKSIAQANRRYLEIKAQSVASEILINQDSGLVSGIRYKRYDNPNSSCYQEHLATARLYVVAAHAVENARLMLASGLSSSSNLVGCGLMDHPALYAWGLTAKPVGAFRGPQSTSGIEDFRAGRFRKRHAAFRYDIGNDGWKSTTGAPDSTVNKAVLEQKLYGKQLRDYIANQLSRQVRMSLAVEQLPDVNNRVSVNPNYRDKFGNLRPVIHYQISEYTFEGMLAARKVARALFKQAGITDYSDSGDELAFPVADYGGETFHYHGMGHFAGTHAMGTCPQNSVVNEYQRCWDHTNLFLVGAGSQPTMGTSNPTLTLAALALRTAEHIIHELRNKHI